MEVVFETPAGRQYLLEIGFFDTVLDLKQRLQRHHNIPISKQTLFFNGTLMEDHKYADEFQLIDGSRINLNISPPFPAPPPVRTSGNAFFEQGLSWFDIAPLSVALPEFEALVPNFGPTRLPYEALSSGETFLQSEQTFPPPILDASQEDFFQIYSRPATSAALPLPEPPHPLEEESETKKKVRRRWRKRRRRTMTLHLTVFKTEGKIKVEVLPGMKVAELRKWLEKNGLSLGLELPDGGFFFIHRQNVMEEEYSFRWHGFQDRDVVEVFPGTVGD